jgi:hypothetical protein
MRMPVSSQNGSSGMRLIARPEARRAVNSSAASLQHVHALPRRPVACA